MKFQLLVVALTLSAAAESASAASPWGVAPSISRNGHAFGYPQNLPSSAGITSPIAGGAVLGVPRGGADSTMANAPAEASTEAANAEEGDERSLEEKVREAMKKYGLDPDAPPASAAADDGNSEMNCEGGVCEIPHQQEEQGEEAAVAVDSEPIETQMEEDINAMANRITAELEVDRQIVLAALGATATGDGEQRRVDESLARELILAERDAISGVTEDCDEVCMISHFYFDGHCACYCSLLAIARIQQPHAMLLFPRR